MHDIDYTLHGDDMQLCFNKQRTKQVCLVTAFPKPKKVFATIKHTHGGI